MRIAVPTNDGATLSGHFGRSAAFLVFEIEDGKIKSREVRANQGCGHGHGEGHSHDQGHSHAGILDVLAGCEVVLCGGMGARAAEALASGGITAVQVGSAGPAESIVEAYLSGELKPAQGGFCRCQH